MQYEVQGFATVDQLVAHYLQFDPVGLRVDLGCGFYKPAGFIGVDNMIGKRSQLAEGGKAPDIMMDLLWGVIPLPDNSCIEVRASHFLEHSNVPHILDETHRLLKPRGIFVCAVPYANSAEGMYPGHNLFFTEKWFDQNPQFQQQFKIDRIDYQPSDTYEKEWTAAQKNTFPFEWARKFMFNVCKQMTIYACVKK